MKSVLLLLLAAGLARANLIPVSSAALISISGTTTVPTMYGGQSDTYATSISDTDFTSFSANLADTAHAQITILPSFQIFLGPFLDVSSSARQTTTISGNVITVNAAVMATNGINSQVGTVRSSARSMTDITFQVDQLSAFALSGQGDHWQSNWPYVQSAFSASLSPVGGNPLFQTNSIGGAMGYSLNIAAPVTGVLTPGLYSLRADLNAIALGDPIGESGQGDLALRLIVTGVPDYGKPWQYLALCLFLLWAVRFCEIK